MGRMRLLVVLSGTLLVLTLIASCAKAEPAEQPYAMAPLSEMPGAVRDAPVVVQEGYQFAVANQEILEQIPCYCGCGAVGHTSNLSCYVQSAAPDGTVAFDGHALGCGICVDITHDTMRLLSEGKTVADILTYVDGRYSQYGPPTP
jgi:hypothetical protein